MFVDKVIDEYVSFRNKVVELSEEVVKIDFRLEVIVERMLEKYV